MPEMK